MANHVGTRLSRLIKERAYAAGRCTQINSKLLELKKGVAQCSKDLKLAKAKVAELDRMIASASAIDPADIKPIRFTPRQPDSKHGAFRRELIRILTEAGGPVKVSDLIAHMAATFNLPMSTGAERERASGLVRRPLNVFKTKGAVMRMPSHPETLESVWCWTDNYVGDGDGA
ncbi:MAG: hypothetical protein ABL867_11395 [Rickettsiales bacterium]